MTNKLIGSKEALEHFQFATINGKIKFNDIGKAVRIARSYSQVVKSAIKPLFEGRSVEELTKSLYNTLPNYIYLETAITQAKTIVEGLLDREKGEIIHAKVKKFWFASRGNKADKGNRNVKFHVEEGHVVVRVRDPWSKEWVIGRAYFDTKYLPLLRELEELSNKREDGYGAVISFKDGVKIHLQVPLWLYLKYFSSPKSTGYGVVAGLDLNSDRFNVVVVDRQGKIIIFRTWWYTETVSHGYSKDKAKVLRLGALSQSLKFLAKIGVNYVVFEDLFVIKSRKFGKSKKGNRKITRFAKKQMLIHGVIKALRLGFNVILINPRGTTNSEEHERLMRERGFDRHTASAYLIALKGFEKLNEYK
ncbi:hypothetical protein [Saccharolobus shibatae]|uniref:Transposase n=1 Tax=Saccharolobus shibatae TaxID=2286 RepID=A0A8F5BTK0_9CREN|nr:hypothetical protein [Saccharolobus shibatae]QXJ31046.1 Uncharacterized protein J5U21_00695 [Saccharolobus shibatae]